MSRASRKANKESSRMVNNSKVMCSTERAHISSASRKANRESSRIIQKFKERNKT